MITTRLPVARIWSDTCRLRTTVLLRQKIHGEVDAVQLAAGHGQVARVLGAAGEQDGVMIAAQVFDRNIAADVRVGDELHAFGAHLLQRRSMRCFSILKFGMP